MAPMVRVGLEVQADQVDRAARAAEAGSVAVVARTATNNLMPPMPC